MILLYTKKMKNKKKKQDKSKSYASHKLQRAGAYFPFCGVVRIKLDGIPVHGRLTPKNQANTQFRKTEIMHLKTSCQANNAIK